MATGRRFLEGVLGTYPNTFLGCALSEELWLDWAIAYVAIGAPILIFFLAFTSRRQRWGIARDFSKFYGCF
jgi:hypothetical protein